jgi:flagellar biosynthesis protein FlhF
MKLKTFSAPTMAEALAQVRKGLGRDAMILHTRTYRMGSWLGLGGKTMVEITASAPELKATKPKQRAMPKVQRTRHATSKPITEAVPDIVVQRAEVPMRAMARKNTPVAVGKAATKTPPQMPIGDDGLEGRDALFEGSAPKQKEPRRPVRAPRILNTSRMQPRSNDDLIQPPAPKKDRQIKTEKVEQVLREAKPAADSASAEPTNDELREQIASMQKMMGQVLESTRRTAITVGRNDSESMLPAGEMPAPLMAQYAKMIDNDVPIAVADKIVGTIRDRLDERELADLTVVRQALLRELEQTIETRSESLLTVAAAGGVSGRPRVIALVGPTGVGKTTTVAKLAATYKLRHHKKVGLITSDTYRIAAVEQLRTYAGIIGLEIKVVTTPEEMGIAIEELSDMDVLIIDTAGRSQNNAKRLDELKALAEAACPDETHLVLSTTVGENVLRKTAERFMPLGPDRCILTKLDEAVTTGPIAGLTGRIGLPLSFVTVGQEVPDDIEPARADRLARAVLDGPEAVVRSEGDG